MKKWGWPGSLRMRLVLLVFICTLPALALVAYRAVDDYQAAAARDSNCPAAFLRQADMGLLRWQHPTRGLISPLDFIPVLEETGLINPVGKWVLEEVAARIADLFDAGLPLPHVAVNLSSRQLHDTQLVNVIRGVLQRYRLPPATLMLELTETLVMRDTRETRMAFDALHELGVCLSVDDFGTGYSSLSYLKRLPLDVLKVDKKFVDEIVSNHTDGTIVGAIIMMAHNLGLQVVAEGVENAAQLDFLRLRACDQIQGYLFSKPLAFTDLRNFLAEGRRLDVKAGANTTSQGAVAGGLADSLA